MPPRGGLDFHTKIINIDYPSVSKLFHHLLSSIPFVIFESSFDVSLSQPTLPCMKQYMNSPLGKDYMAGFSIIRGEENNYFYFTQKKKQKKCSECSETFILILYYFFLYYPFIFYLISAQNTNSGVYRVYQ